MVFLFSYSSNKYSVVSERYICVFVLRKNWNHLMKTVSRKVFFYCNILLISKKERKEIDKSYKNIVIYFVVHKNTSFFITACFRRTYNYALDHRFGLGKSFNFFFTKKSRSIVRHRHSYTTMVIDHAAYYQCFFI